MIEHMKHVTVVCRREDRAATVERLRDLGTVHVRPVHHPESPELEGLAAERDRTDRAYRAIEARKPIPLEPSAEIAALDAASITERVLADLAEAAKLQEVLGNWRRVRAQAEPWGSFSLDTVAAIEARGLTVALGTARAGHLPALPDGAVLHVVSQHGKTVNFAVIAPADAEVPFEPVPFPEHTNLGDIDKQIADCGNRMAAVESRLAALVCMAPTLALRISQIESDIAFCRARDGMGADRELTFLQGYIPHCREHELRADAVANGWGLQIRDPDMEDGDVPTLVVLPRWVEPVRVVFRGLGILPGYREIDISAWFLLFFSLFFAMLIGDAGYGAVFLVVTVLLRKKYPSAPAQPFYLFGILSVATIVWGVLTGVYFGIGEKHVPAPLVPFLVDEDNVKQLCFLLGAIHLTVAHAWNALLCGWHPKALGELAWACILWGNYFLAGYLVLGNSMPGVTNILYGIGITGVVLFSEPQRSPLKTVGAGIGALLLGIVNSFVDVVSYVRLFAVGAASLAVEQSFNEMALGLGLPGPLKVLIAALILLGGHGLNIVLGAMGVLVHGIRLNVLEFSGHLNMQWSGVPYTPLAKRDEA